MYKIAYKFVNINIIQSMAARFLWNKSSIHLSVTWLPWTCILPIFLFCVWAGSEIIGFQNFLVGCHFCCQCMLVFLKFFKLGRYAIIRYCLKARWKIFTTPIKPIITYECQSSCNMFKVVFDDRKRQMFF